MKSDKRSDSRRIVVTGATGFIGSRLCRRLRASGHSVVGFVRDVERARRRLGDGIELVRWSHSETSGEWRDEIGRADAVFNLAGTSIGERWTEERKRSARESRVLGTRHLVEAIGDAPRRPGVLINGSAVGYYGASPAGRVTESSPAGGDFLARLCLEWETEALAARALGVRVVLVRTGVVFDAKEGPLARMLLPFRLFVGGPIGTGRQPVPWIHIDDEVGILQWAVESDEVEGPINATAPGVVANRELAHAIGRTIGRPSMLPTPGLAIRMVLGDGAIVVTEGQHAVPERTEALGYRFEHPEIGEALRSLLAG